MMQVVLDLKIVGRGLMATVADPQPVSDAEMRMIKDSLPHLAVAFRLLRDA